MAQFRGGMMISTRSGSDGEPRLLTDDALGRLLESLRTFDGAVEVEADRVLVMFSFDAEVPPGFAPGLAPAMPRLLAIGRSALVASGIDADVIGLSVERVVDG